METRFSPRSKLIAFWLLAGLTIVGLAHFFSVLAPFLWAIITAYIFTPLITLIAGAPTCRARWSPSVVYLAIMAALIVGIITLVPVVQQQGRELINQLPQTTEAGVDYFYEHFPTVPEQLGLDRVTLQRGINDVIGQITSRVPVTAITVAQRLFHFVLEFFVYLIATFFFFLQGDRFIASMRRAVPLRYQRETERVFGEINSTMGAYLRGQVILIIIMSTVTYIALLDLRYAVCIGASGRHRLPRTDPDPRSLERRGDRRHRRRARAQRHRSAGRMPPWRSSSRSPISPCANSKISWSSPP